MTRRPQPPKHLATAARKKWRELLPSLADNEPMTLDNLTAYAAAWSRMVEAEAKVAKRGVVVRGPGGSTVVNPYLTVLQQERRAVRQLAEALRKRRPSRQQSESADPILRLINKAE